MAIAQANNPRKDTGEQHFKHQEIITNGVKSHINTTANNFGAMLKILESVDRHTARAEDIAFGQWMANTYVSGDEEYSPDKVSLARYWWEPEFIGKAAVYDEGLVERLNKVKNGMFAPTIIKNAFRNHFIVNVMKQLDGEMVYGESKNKSVILKRPDSLTLDKRGQELSGAILHEAREVLAYHNLSGFDMDDEMPTLLLPTKQRYQLLGDDKLETREYTTTDNFGVTHTITYKTAFGFKIVELNDITTLVPDANYKGAIANEKAVFADLYPKFDNKSSIRIYGCMKGVVGYNWLRSPTTRMAEEPKKPMNPKMMIAEAELGMTLTNHLGVVAIDISNV